MAQPGVVLQQVMDLVGAGRLEQARALLQRSMGQRPTPEMLNAMAVVLVQLKHFEQAVYFAQRAAEALPKNPTVLTTLANAHAMRGRPSDAMPVFERALAIDPANTDARLGIANCLSTLRRWDESVQHLAKARELLPPGPARQPIDAAYLQSLHSAGRVEDALAALREWIAHSPDDEFLRGSLAQTLNYSDRATPDDILDAHRAFGACLERTLAPAVVQPHPGGFDPQRRLKIGFVSADLKLHPCSNFTEPLLKHLDRSQFEVFVYFVGDPDANTARLRPLADRWHDAARLGPTELAALIAADGIDVLVELSGLTLGHRLHALHRRPAPVQVTYLGYPNFTGAPFIDARIVDPITDPPAPDPVGVERLVRIDPPFLCFTLWPDAPAPAPVRTPGPPVFGSFNAVSKLTDSTLDAWARILRELSESRLLLKAPQLVDEGAREHLLHRLNTRGIERSRVDVHASVLPYAQHLGLYARMDVGLDPFPYQGTTTTCEALAMGVPVVSLEGRVHAQRVGSSLLAAVDAPELIARTVDEYVAKAVALMRDSPRLARLRADLPGRLRNGPLTDAPAHARRFGQALRTLWGERCHRS